jgi:hypothetical protein
MTCCALCLGLIEPLSDGLNPCPHCGALAVVVSFDVDPPGSDPGVLDVLLEEEEA